MALNMNQLKGYVFSIVMVIIVFVVAAVAGGLLADLVGVWKKPVIGALAAFAVVITGYATAPSNKQTAAMVWLIVGAVAAWILAAKSFYPEDSTYTLKTTIIPLSATYLSGIAALLICRAWHKKHCIVN